MMAIKRLHELGQSLWLDFIRRDLLESGELTRLAENDEIRGLTSNPTIFEQAIAGTELYASHIKELVFQSFNTNQILDYIIFKDVREACDQLSQVYERTNGGDGFVSVEVNPKLANDTERTLEEAQRLWDTIKRPNLMIKIPATLAGLPAIEQAIAKGININVTLIFSIERYVKVMQAYQSGLERRVRSKLPLNDISSVASFFVSRVDTMVDKALQAVGKESLLDTETTKKLKGKAAIANAKLAYQSFQTFVQTKQYLKLRENKARYQRPLWASTSTKNPDFPDTYYVDNLIGPHTVNTVPPDTFDAFQDHGTAEPTLLTGVEEAASTIEAIENLGISMKVVTDRLENEGVEKFAASYANLVDTVRVMVGTLREFGTL